MYDFPEYRPKGTLCDWLPVIAAGVSALGSIAGGLMSNAAAKDRAEEQMEFQREMSNTSYQRGVADLRAAGLNPILAAKFGGASTPTGAMGTTVDFSRAIPEAINSGLAVSRNAAEVDKMNADMGLADAQADKTRAETARLMGMTPHEIEKVSSEVKLIQEQTALTGNTAYRVARLTEPERNKLVEEAIKLYHEGQSAKSIAVQNEMLEKYLSTDAGEWLRKLGFGAKDMAPIVGGIFDLMKMWKLGR